jgi:PAS domain S-box-containing protein
VFIIGLLISNQTAHSFRAETILKNQNYFDFRVREALQSIQNRLINYQQLLQSTSGLFASSNKVDRASFKRYVDALQLEQQFPGIHGVGFSLRVPAAQKASHIAAIRAEGFPDYTVYPAGEREIYTAVVYLEPLSDGNLRAFGYDMYAESVRHMAMQAAIRSGQPALSGKVTLVQDAGKQEQAGFLMYLPVYRNGQAHNTYAERRDNAIGWVYAPFRMNDFMEALLGEFGDDLHIEIFDGEETKTRSLMFSSPKIADRQLAITPQTYPINMYQHSWTVTIQPTATITEHFYQDSFILIELLGSLLSFILAGIVYSLASSRIKIQKATSQLNRRLTDRQQQLSELHYLNNETRHQLESQKFALDQHAIVSITDAAGRIIYANKKFIKISGYSKTEIIGETHRLINSGHHPAEFFKQLHSVINAGQVWQGEIQNRTKAGELYWVATTIVPIKDEAGKLFEFISIRTEITTLKKQEEEIRMFANVIAETDDVVIITEAEPIDLPGTRIVFVNDAFERVTGYRRDEAIGQTPRILQGPQSAREPLDRIRRAMTNFMPIREEVLNYTKDGIMFWSDLKIFPIVNKSGKVTHFVSIQRDISDRKAVEMQLKEAAISSKQSQTAAEALADAKTKFLANMSHEIRTPMNGVIGLSELALQSKDAREIQAYLQEINASSLDLMGILNDILDLSKLDAHEIKIENNPFDLEQLLNSINRLFIINAQKSGVSFDIKCAEGVPKNLIGDSLRVRQVLTNLIGNAFKFTEQGHVSLKVSVANDDAEVNTEQLHLLFRIQDSGIGISAEQINSIFNPFTQADSSITRRFGGTGLGLSISQQLAQNMGGDVQVERSVVGEGTTFIFEAFFTVNRNAAEKLELNQVEIQKKTAVSALATPVTDTDPNLALLAGKRVLLVEDNRINQIVTSKMLEKMNLLFDVADNGEMAINCLQNHAYDLVLMDIQMPVMDGLEATRLIRQNTQFNKLLIVAMSAGVTLDEKNACKDAGMDGFVNKPTSLAALEKEILSQFKINQNYPAKDAQQTSLASLALSGFDLSAVHARVGEDEVLAKELLLIFLDNLPRYSSQMANLINTNQLLEAGSLAQKIKGYADNAGAVSLANSAISLEASLKQPVFDRVAYESFQQIMQQTTTQLSILL